MTRLLRDVLREHPPGVYELGERGDRRLRGRAREGARVRQRRVDARGRSSPETCDRGDQPRRLRLGARQPRARATSCSSPSSSTTRTSCRGSTSRAAPEPTSRASRSTAAASSRSTTSTSSPGRGGQGRRLRGSSRTRSGRSTRSSGSASWAHEQRRDHGRRRLPGGAAQADRRAGARLRLPRLHRPQDVRPERDRRPLGAAGAAPERCRRSSWAAT